MIIAHGGIEPRLGSGVYLSPGVHIIGDVHLGDQVSVWFGSVLRGDVGKIRVGARTNIQDLTVIHVSAGTHDTIIGADVTIGHRAILHGCTIDDLVLVGMGAIVMDGVQVARHCLIGAGALLTPGKKIPERSLVTGSPARVVRQLSDAEVEGIHASSLHYVETARGYAR